MQLKFEYLTFQKKYNLIIFFQESKLLNFSIKYHTSTIASEPPCLKLNKTQISTKIFTLNFL